MIETEQVRQDRKLIAQEFGDGALNVPSYWRVFFKDGTYLEDWAFSAAEAVRGVPAGDLDHVERVPVTISPLVKAWAQNGKVVLR